MCFDRCQNIVNQSSYKAFNAMNSRTKHAVEVRHFRDNVLSRASQILYYSGKEVSIWTFTLGFFLLTLRLNRINMNAKFVNTTGYMNYRLR